MESLYKIKSVDANAQLMLLTSLHKSALPMQHAWMHDIITEAS